MYLDQNGLQDDREKNSEALGRMAVFKVRRPILLTFSVSSCDLICFRPHITEVARRVHSNCLNVPYFSASPQPCCQCEDTIAEMH